MRVPDPGVKGGPAGSKTGWQASWACVVGGRALFSRGRAYSFWGGACGESDWWRLEEGRGRGAGPRVARGGLAAGSEAAQSDSSRPGYGVPTGIDPEPPEEDLDAVQQWEARSARLPAPW